MPKFLPILLIATILGLGCAFFRSSISRTTESSKIFGTTKMFKKSSLNSILRDERGYEIKPKDWFNGLSLDPGGSLTDPRAVPSESREFAEAVKSGAKFPSFQETIDIIDKHYNYFEVPFTNGDIANAANTNTASAKIFSFGLLTRMTEEHTLKLFGEIYQNLTPGGTDHPNIRSFIKNGWPGIVFSSGLAIVSKLQSYDDTESAMATQATIAGEQGWDADSDSWIP